MADESYDTHEMSFDEKLQVVWQAINSQSELIAQQTQVIETLRQRISQLEAIIKRLPTQPLDE